jgi:predicted enzyme related to lactoylglutathione lyase
MKGNVRARRLASHSIYVSSLESSRRVYGDLLGLSDRSRGRVGALVQAGELQLFLHPQDDVDRPPQRLEMTFDVDDADDVIADLRATGVPVVEEATDRNWGDRDEAVEDLARNIVYLRSSPPVGRAMTTTSCRRSSAHGGSA